VNLMAQPDNNKRFEDTWKLSAYLIPSLMVVSVVPVFKVRFVSLIPKSHNNPGTY
jgi:hypothetical protein